ncbi:MAG: hypothetical protein KDD62_04195 [Bdellovibrionales bacterium]|nr:hypothetical protein [Bdellovibrionales bacterium]
MTNGPSSDNNPIGRQLNEAMHAEHQAEQGKLDYMRGQLRGHDLDVGGFMADMIIERAQATLDYQRWSLDAPDRTATPKQIDAVYDQQYPQHVIIAPDAIRDIRLSRNPSTFKAIDKVCDLICSAVAKRLPRSVDAYKPSQDQIVEILEIPDLGSVKVEISHTGNVFSEISRVSGEGFEIWNCRESGRVYKSRYNDTGMPFEVTYGDLKLSLYNDESGLHVEHKGVHYSSRHSHTLTPEADRFNICKAPDVRAALEGKSVFEQRWGTDANELLESLERPLELNWNGCYDQVLEGLSEHVLPKICAVPEVSEQIRTRDADKPYLEQYGPLYAWVPFNDLRKYNATGGDITRLDPEEQAILRPGKRFIAYGEGLPETPDFAHNGFIWLGMGEAKENTSWERYEIDGHTMGSSMSEYRNQLVRVVPKNAEELYVVDYGPLEAFRDNLAKTTDQRRMSDEQWNKIAHETALTIVPIDEYQGSYSRPVVLSARPINVDEIIPVEGVVYEPERF